MFKAVLGIDVNEVYEPVGCPNCSHGYRGRIAIQEVLFELRKLVYSKDVITMLQDGLFKVVAGFTTTEEILKLIEIEDEDIGFK